MTFFFLQNVNDIVHWMQFPFFQDTLERYIEINNLFQTLQFTLGSDSVLYQDTHLSAFCLCFSCSSCRRCSSICLNFSASLIRSLSISARFSFSWRFCSAKRCWRSASSNSLFLRCVSSCRLCSSSYQDDFLNIGSTCIIMHLLMSRLVFDLI